MRAETVAAPASWLLNWESSGTWSPALPIVVFTGAQHGFLDAHKRERMWQRYRVPVFEQMLDADGRRFAFECEAHSGLHIDDGVSRIFSDDELQLSGYTTGFKVTRATEICACGRSGPRIFAAAPLLARVAGL